MLCLCFDVARFDHLHCSIFGTGVQRLPVLASALAELCWLYCSETPDPWRSNPAWLFSPEARLN